MALNRVSIGVDLDISSILSQSLLLLGILGKMNLTSTMKQQFDNLFSSLGSNLTKYLTAFSKGFSSKSDVSNFEKLGKAITTDSDAIDKMFSKLRDSIGSMSSDLLANMFKLDAKDISAIELIEGKINSLKDLINSLNTSNLDKLKLALDPSNFASSKGKSLVAELTNDIENGKLDEAGLKLDEFLKKLLNALNSAQGNADKNGITPLLEKTITTINGNITAAENLRLAFNDVATGALPIQLQIDSLNELKLSIIAENAERGAQSFNTAADSAHNVSLATQQIVTETNKAAQALGDFASLVDLLGSRVKYFFSLTNSVMLFRRALQKAINTVKDLDAVMTEAAVVTDYNVGDMWSLLPEYAARATKLGVSIHDAYESATLYYQQGLKTNLVVAVSNSTLKMARIAGLDAADATDRMTNALRGFKMAINEESAEHIADVYSNLAAHTASNVDEISTAMTKTASLAANANMSFENTAAFLSQIIETTRESAETAGTALKTVIARFSEVKSLYSEGLLMGTDSEGEEINVNKVSQALRTAGINMNEFLTGAKGLDEIFIELASKWDSLTTVLQRYIATTAAGSRQQSRFIALMSDYDRTVELTNMANNSAGASNQQYEKTLDSLESKLNLLQNAWNLFLMGIANSDIIKFGIDVLTGLITAINKITDGLPGVASGFAKIGVAILALKGGSAIFNALIAGFKAAGTTSGITFGKAFRTSLTASLSKVSKITNLFKFDVKKFEIPKNVTSSLNTYTDSMRKSLIAQKALRGEVEGYILTDERRAILSRQIRKADAAAIFATLEYATAMGLTNAQAEIAIAMDGKLLTSQQILGLSLSKLSNEKKEEVLAYLASNGVKLTEVSINKMATASIITEAEAQELSNLVQKKGIPALIANVKAKLKLTAANSSGVVAQMANWLATKMQTDANYKLWLSLGVILVAIIAIIAVVIIIIALITLVIKGIKAFIKNIKDSTPENKVKALQERYKELSEALDAVNSKLDELNSKHDELEEMNNKFEDLVEGTTEWKKNLIDINSLVLALILKYPKLTNYLLKGEYGLLEIREEGWDTIINEELEAASKILTAMLATQKLTNIASNEVDFENREDIEGNKVFGDTSRDAWDWAAEMGESFAGPFNMITDLATEGWDESKINWKKIIPNTLLPGDIVAGLVRGLAETDEDREKIATGGLTQDQYYDFAAAVAEAGYTVTSGEDWDEIKALYLSMGEGYKESDWDNIRSKMEELGASFDELAISAEGVSIANRELERQVQLNIVDAIGVTPDEDAYDMLTNIAMNGEETSEEAIARLEDEIWKNEGVNDSGETDASLRKRYAEEMNYYFNEDDNKVYTSQGGDAIEIDKKTMLTLLATNKYLKEQELLMRKYNNMLSNISDEDKKTSKYKALLGILSENGKNFTASSLKDLNEYLAEKDLSLRTDSNKDEYDKALNEYFNKLGILLDLFNLDYNEIAKNIALGTATQESLYEKAQASGVAKPIRNAIDKLSNSLSTYEIELDTTTTKDFIDNFMLAYEQSGLISDIDLFSSYLSQIIDAAGSEEAALSILAQLSAIDYTDVENLDSAITQLATDFPQLNSLLTDDFKEGLINASLATMNYSEELNNNVKDNFINAKNTYDKLMESGTYTLSAEDKDILIKAKAATESDFISTGITGSDDEFTFVGNTDSLLQKINNSIHDTYKYGETDDNGEPATADQIIAAQDRVEKAKADKEEYDAQAAASGYNDSVAEIFTAGGGSGNDFKNTAGVETLFKEYITSLYDLDNKTNKFTVNLDYLDTLPEPLKTKFQTLEADSQELLAALMRTTFSEVVQENENLNWTDLYNDGNTINTELQEAEQTLADLLTSGYEYYKGKILNALTVGEKQNAYTEFINAFGGTDIYDSTQMAAMEKLLSGSITANYRSVEGGEAQFNYLTEQYQNAMKGTDEYNAALSALATTEAKIQSAIDTTSDSISDSIETMKTADKGTIEYNKALGTLSTGMDEIFDSQSNLLNSTEMQEFTESNLSDILDWAEGSEDAGNRVAQAFALASSAAWGAENDISNALDSAGMSADMTMREFMSGFASWIGDLEEGESIVIGDGNTMATQYAQAIENMVNTLGLSVELATAWLSYLGAEVVGEYDQDGNYHVRVITLKSFTGAYSGFGGYDKSKDDGGSDLKYYEPDYDVFYNIVKDLEDISRNLDDLSTQYERMTNDPNTNYKDIIKNLTERSELLQDSVIKNRALLEARKSLAQDIMNDNADLQQYAKFNQDRNIVEIDYDLIQAQAGVMTEEEGQRLDEYIAQLEEMQSEAEKLEDALNDNYDALEELKNIGKELFLDLELRIYDALVQLSQDLIDKLSDINDSINDANSKLLDTIRSNLDKIRLDRDNEKQEEEINDTAAQLAYLSQDTSGGNQLEILGLQKELDDQRLSYTDALIDLKISELEEQNAKAEEQREQQIDILQSLLDYDKEHGQFWDNVELLMNNAYGTDGAIISGSMLSKVLKGADGWDGMSKLQQLDWENKYKTDITAAKTYMENLKSNFDAKISAIQTATNANDNTTALLSSINGLTDSWTNKFAEIDNYIKLAVSDAASNGFEGGGDVQLWSTTFNGNKITGTSYKSVYDLVNTKYMSLLKNLNKQTNSDSVKSKRNQIVADYDNAMKSITREYATGGLADFTGPAWLDGTRSKPELVLNAKDTQNFIQLRDVLAEVMGSNYQVTTQDKDSVKGGDNYFTIDISVDKLENDYDVEALAEQIKRMINDDAMYRNVNVINLLR